MVINGTHRGDWDDVVQISKRVRGAIPAFGFHPWFLSHLKEQWQGDLVRYLTTHHGVIGEIGIDHWKEGIDLRLQESVFREQLAVAAQYNIPATIHGLKAWDRVLQILREMGPFPAGVLLHSYSGPEPLIRSFVDLGAYFSCSGALLSPKREKALQVFATVPEERLLIESDTPDQFATSSDSTTPLVDSSTGARLTHPLSIKETYRRLATLRTVSEEHLCQAVERNFLRLFGRFFTPAPLT
jgi:TatD DNase family protein